MLFETNRTYKFRHIQNAGIVRDRADLEKKKQFGFPAGRLLTPRDRQWTGGELNHYLETRPTTQAEMDALPNRAPKTTPNIPKPKAKTKTKTKTANRKRARDRAA